MWSNLSQIKRLNMLQNLWLEMKAQGSTRISFLAANSQGVAIGSMDRRAAAARCPASHAGGRLDPELELALAMSLVDGAPVMEDPGEPRKLAADDNSPDTKTTGKICCCVLLHASV